MKIFQTIKKQFTASCEECKSFGAIRKTRSAAMVSVFVVAVFVFMQAMEIHSATSSQVTLNTTVSSAISVSCTSSVELGSLVAGSPVSGSTTCTTSTNNSNGYYVQVKRDDATGTLKSGATYIPDKTAWTSNTPNAAVWSGTGLGFRVKQTGTTATYNTTWWGADDTASNAKFAGLPSGYETIMNHPSYSASTTNTVVDFKVDVPPSQATGNYSGTVTFQTIANP